MPNIGSVLKDEVSRLARKELRGQTETLKKASVVYRRDIAALKRTVAMLERKVALLESRILATSPAVSTEETETRVRFSAKGLRSLRTRLGLSAADMATLVGVAQQSIYNWEKGQSRPRGEQMAVLAALRGMGKKEVRARLEVMAKE